MNLIIPTPPDFDFVECVTSHGWRQLEPFSWDAETKVLQRIHQFENGEVGVLTISNPPEGVVMKTDSNASELEIKQIIATMFQLGISLADFYDYCSTSEKLNLVCGSGKGRLLRSPTLFEDVVKVIATTNTTWAQTKGMVSRIVQAFGSRLPSNPDQKAFPTPKQIASVSLEEFSDKAKMGYRNVHVHKIATDIVSGALDLESWQDQSIPSADLYKHLLSLPGIGPYAASCLLIYLGHYDCVNVDSWARTLVSRELGKPVNDKEVHAFFEPYGKWKALVYHFYPWKDEPLPY